jgi:hypothetical protein
MARFDSLLVRVIGRQRQSKIRDSLSTDFEKDSEKVLASVCHALYLLAIPPDRSAMIDAICLTAGHETTGRVVIVTWPMEE